MDFDSLKSVFIKNYVDLDDWRTAEWSYLSAFLNFFARLKKRSTSTVQPLFASTSSPTTSFSATFSTIPEDLIDLHNVDLRDILLIQKRIYDINICPHSELKTFKIIVEKYLNECEQLVKYSTGSLQLYRYLRKIIVDYGKLFMSAIDNQVK